MGYICMGSLPSIFKVWRGIVMSLGRNAATSNLFYSCNFSAESLELRRDDSFFLLLNIQVN